MTFATHLNFVGKLILLELKFKIYMDVYQSNAVKENYKVKIV